MKLAALGVLAAMLGAGCAFEASDPGEADTRSSEGTVSVEARGRTTVTTASPPGPGSSPQAGSQPSAGGSASQGVEPGSNPEPSPWYAGAPVEPSGGPTAPAGNGAGAVAGAVQASGGTPTAPYRLLGR
jgi:hypothetical protein